jgi:hypothetical protein
MKLRNYVFFFVLLFSFEIILIMKKDILLISSFKYKIQNFRKQVKSFTHFFFYYFMKLLYILSINISVSFFIFNEWIFLNFKV